MTDITVSTGSKTCPNCGATKLEGEFFRKGSRRQSWCKVCTTRRRRDWGRENPRKIQRHRLKNRYGMTPEQQLEMLESQDWTCVLCPADLRNGFHTDHDHATGAVRGMLCRRCNHRLGWVERIGLKNIAAYLARG